MIHINRTRRQTWWNNEHADSGAHGLLVSGNLCGTKIVSDGTWFAVPHPAYSNDIVNDMNENFRASEPDICYDARIANSNAFMHDYWTRGHTHAPSPLSSAPPPRPWHHQPLLPPLVGKRQRCEAVLVTSRGESSLKGWYRH